MSARHPQTLPQTLPYHLTGEIRARIIRGLYAPGRPLREQDLERTFGSSRGPIRESLLMLQKRGLVDHQPRRGFRVRVLSARELAHLYRLQATLYRSLVEELDEVDHAALAAQLKGHLEVLDDGPATDDPLYQFNAVSAFDRALMEAPGNTFLRDALGSLVEVASPVTFAILADGDAAALSRTLHTLADAVRASDLDAVGELLDGRVSDHAAWAAARVDGEATEHVPPGLRLKRAAMR
ncbi:GntR family transcriptional regulator [Zavarzinia sp. CC-PAN008]|uniref:GntR family transcriptional regulator n=1 Tax=Zavarzinia sp. CC-PAN008 TaxID=3243332 RepID=UPI003F746229